MRACDPGGGTTHAAAIGTKAGPGSLDGRTGPAFVALLAAVEDALQIGLHRLKLTTQ